ncbi:putative corazonin preprohormone [Daphnia pulex]|uniref:Putative corazonin preprohormone n=1 Tax=Daphnia pulex TaxID=6669 RepID=E9G155_DAPPU|nr:putative corazonin preprohormone [Daphnia pulex]|eukprot:EFX86608.1 putative corazonin preprohormone [Daphnia pulex]
MSRTRVRLNLCHPKLFESRSPTEYQSKTAQSQRYSRGWTNGRKRSDPSFVQQQQWIQRNGHPMVIPAEFRSNSFEDWSRYRINGEKVNEDGDSWLVHVSHCAKLATSLGSVLKNKDAKSDDNPLIDVIH